MPFCIDISLSLGLELNHLPRKGEKTETKCQLSSFRKEQMRTRYIIIEKFALSLEKARAVKNYLVLEIEFEYYPA